MGKIRSGNTVISGSGQLSGGRYKDVRISGSGKVNGDLHAEEVKVSGSAKFDGDVAARSIKLSGSSRFNGSIETGDYRLSGSSSIGGHLHSHTIQVSGSLTCMGAIRAEAIKLSGHMKVDRGVEAETFKGSGGFRIEGLLNASEVEVKMNNRCYAGDIGGDQIEIRVAPLNLFWKLMIRLMQVFDRGSRLGLRSEVIEGTDILLEWTEARAVRGQRVRIGTGCHIDLVEYVEDVYIDPEASVKEVRQIQS